MSVLVKGMEKPEACLDCDFCNPFTEKPYCRRLMKVTPKTTTLPDCPLVPVPEHGRLIDADALSSKLTDLAECEWNQSTGTTWAEAFEEVDGFVQDAPTIIEAEEER